MTSPLLALFIRSLREEAHSKATFWVRGGVGGFILLVLVIFALVRAWTPAPGRNFFTTIVILQIVSITLIGLSYFASAVAEEKEEQTLGLLRMTDLSPLAILLGKSTSRLCGALFLLVALFPFTVFAVTLGGVSLGQIVATYCTLGAYTFLLCNVALLGSVLARHTAGAATFSAVVMAVLVGAGPLLGSIAGQLPAGKFSTALQGLGEWLWATTAIARLREVLSTLFDGTLAGWQVGSNVALGIIFFLLAWAAFERFCDQTSAEAVASGPIPRPVLGVRLGRPPRPEKDALTWKDYHFLCGGRMGMIVRCTFYGGLFVLASVDTATTGRAGMGGVSGFIFGIVPFIFSIDIAAMAVRLFRTELNDQTLSALAVLPCSMREIARRKARACLIAALPGGVAVVGGGLLAMAGTSGAGMGPGLEAFTAAQTVSGWLGMFLLVHLAAWLSLAMKRGALPVSYVLTQVLQTFITGLSMAIVSTASGFNFSMSILTIGPIGAGLCCLVLGILLHRKIPPRLETLAGEG